ncbi:DUF397 domain-containing protein (plasmid) [Streptomyces niveus]|uniref:DUF397 domain-containing protein n=1 Tax=Streptomyces niveus TaxID=193462 RepID=UPI002E302450|nr:DUF397 domain-containing protein [Streptomyces niveus]
MINEPSCSELAAASWFKSTYSAPNNECVEVADLAAGIGVRDSKTTGGPVMVVGAGAFAALVDGLRDGIL